MGFFYLLLKRAFYIFQKPVALYLAMPYNVPYLIRMVPQIVAWAITLHFKNYAFLFHSLSNLLWTINQFLQLGICTHHKDSECLQCHQGEVLGLWDPLVHRLETSEPPNYWNVEALMSGQTHGQLPEKGWFLEWKRRISYDIDI